MSELTCTLREYAGVEKHSRYLADALNQAADEIERTQAELAATKAELVTARARHEEWKQVHFVMDKVDNPRKTGEWG